MSVAVLTSTEETYKADCNIINDGLKTLESKFEGEKNKVSEAENKVSESIAKFCAELNNELLSNDALDLPPHVGKPCAVLDNLSPWFRLSTVADLGTGIDKVELFDSRKLSVQESRGLSSTTFDTNNFVKSITVNFAGEAGDGLSMNIDIVDPNRVCAELFMLQYLTKQAKGMIMPIILDFGWANSKGPIISDGDTTVFFQDSCFGYIKSVEEKYDAQGQVVLTLSTSLDPVKTLGLLGKKHMLPYYVFAQNVTVYLGAIGALKIAFKKLAGYSKNKSLPKPLTELMTIFSKYDMCSKIEASSLIQSIIQFLTLSDDLAGRALKAFEPAGGKEKYRLDGFAHEKLTDNEIKFAQSALESVPGLAKEIIDNVIAALKISFTEPKSFMKGIDIIRSLSYHIAVADESDKKRDAVISMFKVLIGSCGARVLIHPAFVLQMVTESMTIVATTNGLGDDKITIASPIFKSAEKVESSSMLSSNSITDLFGQVPLTRTAYMHPPITGAATSLREYCKKLGSEFCSKADYAKYGVSNGVYMIQPLNTWFDVMTALVSKMYINMQLTQVIAEKIGIQIENKSKEKFYNVPVAMRFETQAVSLYGKDGKNEALSVFTKRISTLFTIVRTMVAGRDGKVDKGEILFTVPTVSTTDPYATWYFSILTVDNGALLTQDPLLNRYVAAFSYRAAAPNGQYDPGHSRVWDVNFPDVVSFEPTFSLRDAMRTAGSLAKQTIKGMSAQGVKIDVTGERLKAFAASVESLLTAINEGGVERYRSQWGAIKYEANLLTEELKKSGTVKPILDNFTYTVNAQEHTSTEDYGMAMVKTQKDMQRLNEYMMLHPSGGFSIEGTLKTYGNPYFAQQSLGSIVFLKYTQMDGTIGLLTGNYIITGVSHTIEPGAFWTSLKLRGMCDRSSARIKDLYTHLYEKKQLCREW